MREALNMIGQATVCRITVIAERESEEVSTVERGTDVVECINKPSNYSKVRKCPQ